MVTHFLYSLYRRHNVKLFFIIIICQVYHTVSAQSINLKGGLNYINISKADISQFNTTSQSGYFMGGGVTTSDGLIRFTSELLFSKQGYDYKNGTATGNVDLQYLLFPQTVSLNLGEFFSIHTGLQLGFATKLKIDSTTLSGDHISLENLAKNIKKVNISVVAGAELSPVKGLFIGARYNHPLGNFLKNDADKGLIFAPDKNLKNNLIQIYAGIRFSLDGYKY
jgi:hypothetical protein